jgi:uroporphyrinogen-III synthase
MAMSAQALQDRLIAVPEARELDLFAALLERRGARVLRAPLIAIHDAPDPQPVLAWLGDFSAGGCDDLILLTGEGLRRLLACLERWQPQLRPRFLQALAQVRKITRGPKPARALRELGLSADLEALSPTTDGVMASLATLALRDRTVGLQLYGAEPNLRLQDFLRAAGARLKAVAPYVYASASDDAAVRALLGQLRSGAVDAIAFTSKAQIERLFAVAPAAEVHSALAATQVAAVGPLVAQALQQRGLKVDAMPESNWSMKPLSAELARLLTRTAAAETPAVAPSPRG